MQRLEGQCKAANQQLEVLRMASEAARGNEETLLQTVDRLQAEVLDYASRLAQALEGNAGQLGLRLRNGSTKGTVL